MKTSPFLFFALMFPIMGLAAEVPEGSMVTGVLGSVNATRSSVIVEDRTYYLTATTVVESANGSPGAVGTLVRGQRVGLDFKVGEDKRFYITTIRVLAGEMAPDR